MNSRREFIMNDNASKYSVEHVISELGKIALSCEDGERDYFTGLSTWPKETTVEWRAAQLLGIMKEALEHIVSTEKSNDCCASWYDCTNTARQALGWPKLEGWKE
jgi:hypothetical protein